MTSPASRREAVPQGVAYAEVRKIVLDLGSAAAGLDYELFRARFTDLTSQEGTVGLFRFASSMFGFLTNVQREHVSLRLVGNPWDDRRLIREADMLNPPPGLPQDVYATVELWNDHDQNSFALLLREVVTDPARLTTFFGALAAWYHVALRDYAMAKMEVS